MAKEIVIPNPRINSIEQEYRRYSFESDSYRRFFFDCLKQHQITPKKYPKAVDLFAGDGSLAAFLKEKGWQEGNITCVDNTISPTPLVDGAEWLYWDLRSLSRFVQTGEPIPPEIQSLAHSFDVVVMSQSYLDSTDNEGTLCRYFVRPGGFVLSMSEYGIIENP